MAKCKTGCKTRIISNVVQTMNNCDPCVDVCVNPPMGEPNMLSLMAPLIYDEIGINLCTTFTVPILPAAYITAQSASIQVLNITYSTGGIGVEPIVNRPNCYSVSLTDLTVQFAVSFYDANCRLLGTDYPTAVYLPSDPQAETYDEETNPSLVELEIFAPYGVSYQTDTTGVSFTPIINYMGRLDSNNSIQQGLNLYAYAKALNLDAQDGTMTVGLTLVLQSLYFVGYHVKSEGRIQTPKGSLILPDNTSCLRFVAGDLLDLAIKPLELQTTAGCEGTYQELDAISKCDVITKL